MKTLLSRRRLPLFALACLAAALVAGCGGGLGGSTTRLSGFVAVNTATKAVKAGRLAGTSVANAVVTAYVWPDLTKPVAQATTDSNGWYTMSLPNGSAGKDIVLIAQKGTGTEEMRLSLIVPDVPNWGKTVANLDEASTLAAETVVARVNTVGGSIDDVAGSAIETIAARIRSNGGIDSSAVLLTGGTLPATFGSGLLDGSVKTTYISDDTTVQQSVASIAQESNAEVKRARRMAQMLRDAGRDSLENGMTAIKAIVTDIGGQVDAIGDIVQPMVPFLKRTAFAYMRMGMPYDYSNEPITLVGQTPGIYALRGSTGSYTLVRTGNSSDGKSWTLAVEADDYDVNYRNDVFTITPQVALDTFALDPAAKSFALRIHNTVDTTVNYTATLAATTQSSGVIRTTLDASYVGGDLTSAVRLQGTLLGSPEAIRSTRADGVMATFYKINVNGTLTGPNFTGSLNDLTMEWNTNWLDFDNIKSIGLSSVHASLATTPVTSLDLSDVAVEFYPSETTPAEEVPDLKHFHASGTVKVAGHTFTARDLDVALGQRQVVGSSSRKSRAISLSSIPPIESVSGSINFVGPTMTLTGSASGSWSNPSTSWGTVANFPNLNFHVAGALTSIHGFNTSLDMTLTSSNTGANPTMTLTLAKLAYGPETLTGTVQAVFDVEGTDVDTTPTITANMNLAPESLAMTMSGKGSAMTGTLSHGGVVAGHIGYSDTGDTLVTGIDKQMVIKYADGTFETVASVLPSITMSDLSDLLDLLDLGS